MCCRSDRGLELHHILGRVSDSALNACPLCTICHSHIGHSRKEQIFCFTKNYDYLTVQEQYELLPEDKQFIEDHKQELGL